MAQAPTQTFIGFELTEGGDVLVVGLCYGVELIYGFREKSTNWVKGCFWVVGSAVMAV